MDSTHNADAPDAQPSVCAAGGIAAAPPSRGSEHNTHPSADGAVNPSSGAVANESARKPSSNGLDAPMCAENSAEPSSSIGSSNGSASPKPKIRIKLKLSPKRTNDELTHAETDGSSSLQGGKRKNFDPNKSRMEGEQEDDPMEVDAEPTTPAVERTTSKDAPADHAAKNERHDSDDDVPMMSLKSKLSKNAMPKSASIGNDSSSPAQPTAPKTKTEPADSSNEPKKRRSQPPKAKLFSGTLRSAAAAHRNRQIHVPPIGSPGLLMIPNPSLVANFPLEDGGVDKKKKTTLEDVSHLLHNGFILPRTVYEQSMIAGGYTLEKRMDDPHRGSSTERTVGDMFDSDVTLYLHFPELIPPDLWERRLKKAKVVKEMEIDEKKTVLQEETERSEASDEDENGPRLVDMMIQSLSKLTGDELHTVETSKPEAASASVVSTEPPSSDVADTAKPDSAVSEPNLSAPEAAKSTAYLESRKLPQFNPTQPGIRKRSRPHQPISFLNMIPISLTSTYPPDYVQKRRVYNHAVKKRDHLIVESQEAADDAVDNEEKFQAHKEAWDRMFEYQKLQIAKREAAAEEAERNAREDAGNSAYDTLTDRNASTSSEVQSNNGTKQGNSESKQQNERKKEDPMDYMPKPPEPPPPPRFIAVPDIPFPPDHPSIVEVDETSENNDETTKDCNTMYIPRVDPKFIRHLDPACFFPTVEGRYFGLLSNYIADPQFVGPLATGIRGVTSGGGTGLATSYVGGGRGAAGLVSGPIRGGLNSWQQARDSQSSSGKSTSKGTSNPAAKKKKTPTITESTAASDKEKNSDAKPSPDKPSSVSSSSKKKRRASEIEEGDDSGSKKKAARNVIPLATGDRNTLATEIASGPAGEEMPDGWTVKTYRRNGGETVGKTDRFWFSPGLNIRFRAKKHAMSFIEILQEPECNGDEQIAAETYRARGLHF